MIVLRGLLIYSHNTSVNANSIGEINAIQNSGCRGGRRYVGCYRNVGILDCLAGIIQLKQA